MPTFWLVKVVVATYEIQPSVLQAVAARDWRLVALSPLEPLYWTNVFEGWLLLRYGWISLIVFRLVFYLVWHVIYGGLALSRAGAHFGEAAGQPGAAPDHGGS